VHALAALSGRYITKEDLASNAIHIEQKLIGEPSARRTRSRPPTGI